MRIQAEHRNGSYGWAASASDSFFSVLLGLAWRKEKAGVQGGREDWNCGVRKTS